MAAFVDFNGYSVDRWREFAVDKTVLNFHGCHLNDEAIVQLAQMLKTNPVVTQVNLDGIRVSNVSAEALARALEENLVIGKEFGAGPYLILDGRQLSLDGARSLFSALDKTSRLEDCIQFSTQLEGDKQRELEESKSFKNVKARTDLKLREMEEIFEKEIEQEGGVFAAEVKQKVDSSNYSEIEYPKGILLYLLDILGTRQ